MPRITARIRSPSATASSSRLSITTAQPSAETNPSARDVECMAAAGRRQHARRRASSRLARFEQHRDPARQGEIALALVQAAACHVDGAQARRTCRINRDGGTVHAQRVGDTPGRKAETRAGEPVRTLQRAGVCGQIRVIVMRQSHEHTGLRAGQRRRV